MSELLGLPCIPVPPLIDDSHILLQPGYDGFPPAGLPLLLPPLLQLLLAEHQPEFGIHARIGSLCALTEGTQSFAGACIPRSRSIQQGFFMQVYMAYM